MSLTVTMTEMDGSEEPSRDFRLLAELAELHAARLPVSVDTYLGSRDSMAIVGVSTPIEARDGRSVTAVVSLKEVRVVDSVQTAVPKEFIAAIMRPDTEAQERRGRDDAGGDADSLGVRLLGGQDRARELLRIRVDADGNPL